MRTEEEIRLKRAYLQGYAEAIVGNWIADAEKTRIQIEMLKWVLNDDIKDVVVEEKIEDKNDR